MNLEIETIKNYNSNISIPIQDVLYPKIFSYIPVKKNDYYEVIITDDRIQYIDKIEIYTTIHEIKGKGIVCYKKFYPFCLIDNFKIYYKNNLSDDEKLLYEADNDELLMNIRCNQLYNHYLDYTGGKNDEYCYEKEGKYMDDIVFKKKNIVIPIELHLKFLKIFSNTILIFRFKINNILSAINYNTKFYNTSLKQLQNDIHNKDINIKLKITNTILNNQANYNENKNISSFYNKPMFFSYKKKTFGQHGTSYLNSSEFKNSIGLMFYSKSSIFQKKHRFIINVGVETKEKTIISSWVSQILNDMIIVTDKDMSLVENKLEFGFSELANFEEVKKNVIFFDKRNKCKIYIELVPEGYKIFYHKNILSFSRRYKKNDLINVSNLFSYIRGVFFFDENKINYNIKDIKHNINLNIASIPVDIWNNINNTETGDLRSSFSKEKDFYYDNQFLLGVDYLSKDKGYNSVLIEAGRDILDNCSFETKNTSISEHDFKINEFEHNSYHNISFFNTLSVNKKFVIYNPKINFNKFLCKINNIEYKENDPKNLIDIYPYCVIYELMTITYDEFNKTIIVEPFE